MSINEATEQKITYGAVALGHDRAGYGCWSAEGNLSALAAHPSIDLQQAQACFQTPAIGKPNASGIEAN